MKEGNYISVTFDDLPSSVLICLEGSTVQALQDEANAILRAMGGWCDAYLVTYHGESVTITDIEEN